jgi:hypothetical protein
VIILFIHLFCLLLFTTSSGTPAFSNMSLELSNALQDSTESASWNEEVWQDWMEEESSFVDKFAFGDALPAQLAVRAGTQLPQRAAANTKRVH